MTSGSEANMDSQHRKQLHTVLFLFLRNVRTSSKEPYERIMTKFKTTVDSTLLCPHCGLCKLGRGSIWGKKQMENKSINAIKATLRIVLARNLQQTTLDACNWWLILSMYVSCPIRPLHFPSFWRSDLAKTTFKSMLRMSLTKYLRQIILDTRSW